MGEGRLRIGALLLAAAALVGACSSDGGRAERSPDASTTTATPGSTGTSGTSAEPTPPGGPLRLGLAGAVTLDPASASPASASAMALADLVHDGLTALDGEGVPQPALADFVPNEDLRVWRFTLREGVTFADGSPIEADDVVFSLERIRAQGGASLAAIQIEDVASVTALDPRTVEVTLADPSALLPEVLSSPLYGVVDREAPPSSLDAPLNPSGAHRVASSPERLVLERRTGTGPPAVEVGLFADEGAALDAFLAGELDWSPVPVDRLGAVEGDRLAFAPFHATVLLGVNPSVEPLARPALRQAIALAVDRAAITAAVFGPSGRPAEGLVPAGIPGAAASCVAPCGPDLDRARQLVAEAFADGAPVPPVRLLVDQTSTHDAIARILVPQLAEIGLEVTAEPAEEGAYAARLGSGQEQLFLHSTLGVARSPASHLLPWASDSPDNTTRYTNPLVDLALAGATVEPDRAVRLARWREVEAAVLGDAPVVPLSQLHTAMALAERARGIVLHADGSIDLSAVELGG